MATTRSFLAMAALSLAPALCLAAPLYTATPLGNLGGSSGDVRALNNAGQVVGHVLSTTSAGNAFVANGGVLTNLHPEGAGGSFANGINHHGLIAGTVVEAGGVSRAVTFDGALIHELGNLGGRGQVNSSAAAVNDGGQVAGTSDLADGAGHHAFLHTPGGALRDLGTLGGANSMASAINQAGVVVGRADTATGSYHAFRHANGVMTDLGTLGGTFSEASGINDGGAISGFSYLAGNAYAHAFMLADGLMIDLGTLGGNNSFAYGINNLGQLVGSSEVTGGNGLHAFVYAGGSMTDLNSLVAPGFEWTLNYASDINELGQIAAFGCNTLSQCQGFLLTPASAVPEPATPVLVLLGLGVLLLITCARRRPVPRRLPQSQ